MKLTDVNEKKPKELKSELLSLLREQFNLRMQKVNNQQQKVHLLRFVRRNISRIKTFLTLMKKDNK